MSVCRSVAVLSHARPQQVAAALQQLLTAARECDVALHFEQREALKHGLQADPEAGILVDPGPVSDIDLCVVLGGDGTILRGLRRYAGTRVPVFAVNFGEVGFLATMDPNGVQEGFQRAFSGAFETMAMPSVTVGRPEASWVAFNDISFHRKVGGRVAQLAYGVEGEEVGSVRCDGLVVCTPAGSTGYNLANGGPVLAWGVEGFGVSFIAPHSLT
ncbi:MAG TPA: NAD(+)/NADH kinase, partial [Solirubrobacteraceae bacterium]|nr:NAD(+)/NADH kinase [Solirubrobacteraceae bacterium]